MEGPITQDWRWWQ